MRIGTATIVGDLVIWQKIAETEELETKLEKAKD